MRCKKHYTDLSSINGVCATCLRQRLFILIQQQSQAQSQSQTLEDDTCHNPTLFPRSVSPYAHRNSTRQHNNSLPDHRFFSTPQVGPTFGESYNNDNKKKKKKSFIKFSLLKNLFRSKKTDLNGSGSASDLNSDHPRVSNSVTGESATSSTSSPSWFSVKSHRKKHNQPVVTKQFCPDRGMSPARYSDCDEFCDGYESCESRKQTPWRTPARRVNSTASGLTFCLSPLVRASPCRNWNQKTPPVTTVMTAVDGGGGSVKPHLVNTKSFCASRSRKLADFGRLNPNR